MRFKKVYLEITNVCNLACSFCPGTVRTPRFLSAQEFSVLAERLQGWTEYLYFHLMGEPLLHPELDTLLSIASQNNFYVNLTTNGTLLGDKGAQLLNSNALHRINISLQSFEANAERQSIINYVNACAKFAQQAADHGVIVSLRLWNGGGAEQRNTEILDLLRAAFPKEWQLAQKNTVLTKNVFLEFGEQFDWPAADGQETGTCFCRGLRDQLGVLCDGTVVPCCLDADGRLALGNLFTQNLGEILESPRARAIYDGFSHREAVEPLCQRCGYAARF